ncbi:BTAD domain-containing putative transcriptional regulator [Streptomyces sp. NPDC048489]|uniref:AfsR/SARP family transcriptional regulator n=1 Tax=Streptomyces sp. NPDC048489 TaxID=3154504 RepID=UPI00343E9C25
MLGDRFTSDALGLRYLLLGPLRILRSGRELKIVHAQQRAVLASLLLRSGARVSLDQLVDDVWGADAPRSAVPLLRTYVHGLRRTLRDDLGDPIISVTGGYMMSCPRRAVDVGDFEALLDSARTVRTAGEPAAALESFTQSIALWTDRALADVPGPFAELSRVRLEDLRFEAHEGRAACLLELGDSARAAADLTVLAAENPLRERLQELLMLALYRSGRRAKALETYRAVHRAMTDEIGVEPGSALARLHQQILEADPALDTGAPTSGPAPTSLESGHSQREQSPTSMSNPSATAVTRQGATPASSDAKTLGDGPAPIISSSKPETSVARQAIVPAQLPAALPVFVGRERLRALALESSTSPIVVHGTAGVGKTSFGLSIAHELAHRFPDGQLYAELRGFDSRYAPRDPSEIIFRFLEALGVAVEHVPDDLDARVSLYRTLVAKRRLLVVLDDARSAEQVRPLLPASSECLAVITSRSRLLGLRVTHQARYFEVPPFDSGEASEYLGLVLGAQRADAEPGSIERIATVCGGLPLALAIAAARAAETDILLEDVASDLGAPAGQLDVLVVDNDPAANVRAVFSWSYEALSEMAARLFRSLAQHPGPFLTADAAAVLLGVGFTEASAALGELVDAHLLRPSDSGHYSTHDLLHMYATELNSKCDEVDTRALSRRRLLDHYTHTMLGASRLIFPNRKEPSFPSPVTGSTPRSLLTAAEAHAWLDAQYPVLRALIEDGSTHGDHAHVWLLAWALETYIDNRGLWSDFLAVQKAGLAAAKGLRDRERTARAHRSVARAEFRRGRLDLARQHGLVALRLLPDDADYVSRAETHRQLTWIFTERGEHAEAVQHAMAGLHVYEAVDGEHERTMMAHSTVAFALVSAGEYELCLEHCEKAEALQNSTGSAFNHADTQYCAGYAHQHLGAYNKAYERYDRAAQLYQEGRVSHGVATVYERLAELHEQTGRSYDAERCRREALAIYQDLGDPRANSLLEELNGA